MLARFSAILVTLLSISFSSAVRAEQCAHSVEQDELWLKSQPIEPIQSAGAEVLVTQKVLAYLQSKACNGLQLAELLEDIKGSRLKVLDGFSCVSHGQNRVSLLLSTWQTKTFYCQ